MFSDVCVYSAWTNRKVLSVTHLMYFVSCWVLYYLVLTWFCIRLFNFEGLEFFTVSVFGILKSLSILFDVNFFFFLNFWIWMQTAQVNVDLELSEIFLFFKFKVGAVICQESSKSKLLIIYLTPEFHTNYW